MQLSHIISMAAALFLVFVMTLCTIYLYNQPQALLRKLYVDIKGGTVTTSLCYTDKYITSVIQEVEELNITIDSQKSNKTAFRDINKDSLFLKSFFEPFTHARHEPIFTKDLSGIEVEVKLRTSPVTSVKYFIIQEDNKLVLDSIYGLKYYIANFTHL